jgi:fructokinase
MPLRFGIDLGGTKIEGIALDEGQERARERLATPRDDYAATIETIARVVGRLEGACGHPRTATVGVGIPGVANPDTGLIKNANSTWLIGRPLGADLQARLGRPVRIANDANCFAVSEATDGAAAGADVVFGVIIGTGVGAGVVVRGGVLTGPNGVAGEWGHNPLPWPQAGEWPGPACYCGKTGCIETFLSGPGMARDHAATTGVRCAPEEIVSSAAHGLGAAMATLSRYEDRCARALAAVINVLDPDVIVLGGGMSNIERLYRGVPACWGRYVFGATTPPAESAVTDVPAPARPSAPRPPRTRLVRALHGDSSGVRGAAWLWEPDPLLRLLNVTDPDDSQ